MQLKRDTDYALRLLLSLAKHTHTGEEGVSVQTLSREAQVPITIANRLCSKMEQAKLLHAVHAPDKTANYLLGDDTLCKTLYDVVCAVEGLCDLFAVFDRTTDLFSDRQPLFQTTEQQFVGVLHSMTLQQLMPNG